MYLEEQKQHSLMENQLPSKTDLENIDEPEDPEENATPSSYQSPIKSSYLSNPQLERSKLIYYFATNDGNECCVLDLFQIQEEAPHSSSSLMSDRKTENTRNRADRKSSIVLSNNYHSIISHPETYNETFLL